MSEMAFGEDEVEREPCPQCGEPAALAARICPHCRMGLLVDLVVAEGMLDARVRYQAAKAIGASGPPFVPFAEAHHALEVTGSVLARGLTRLQARDALTLLAPWDVRTTTPPAQAGTGAITSALDDGMGSGSGWRWAAVAVISCCIVGAGVFALKRPGVKEARQDEGASRPKPATGQKEGTSRRELRMPKNEGTSRPEPATAQKEAESRPTLSMKAGAAVQIPASAPRLSTRDLAERVLAATVALRCGARLGAGFFVAPNLVVTNLHVSGQGGDPIEVRQRGGQTASAWVERSSERLDIALLRVSGLTAPPLPLPLGDATSLGPGSLVLAAGSPVGLDFTVTQGILSHTERTILGVVYLQFDGSVNPGNSGGPLVDDAGRVIGIVSMKAHGASGIGLALPVNYLVAGTEAWIPAPGASREGAVRWQAVLQRADEENGRAVVDATDFLRRPGLVGVTVGRDGRLMALVIIRSHFSPSSEPLRFSVRRKGNSLCRFDETATRWVPGSASLDDYTFSSRQKAWMKDHGITADVYTSAVRLGLGGCPAQESLDGATLELEGGDSKASRVVIGAGS